MRETLQDVTQYQNRERDHPRVCGKHAKRKVPLSKTAGSPPRMRETLGSKWATIKAVGITPAYAGNTLLPTGRTT